MADISGFPYFEVEFTKNGDVHDDDQVKRVADFVGTGQITDLFVFSHGWNNDMAEARKLYKNWFACMRTVLDAGRAPAAANRKFGVLGVLWPSKKFAEDELIASGAAAVGDPIPVAALQKQVDELKKVFDTADGRATLDEAKKLLPKLQNDPNAQKEFVERIRSLVTRGGDADDASDKFFSLKPEAVMERLSKPTPTGAGAATAGTGGAAGGVGRIGGGDAGSAAGLGDFFSGIKSAARNLMNFTTYYEMKERAGVVGRKGLNGVLRKLRGKKPDVKLHLIGHSFGGRVVTAAADGPQGQPVVKVESMTLLQAAFSHNGFAQKFHDGRDGAFRKVVTEGKVKGPILITHTENDKAVGKAYPSASLLSGVDASAFGDESSRFGGLGRNGAVKTPEAVKGKLLPLGQAYQFQSGKLYNLQADKFIGGHSDICKDEVACAVALAVATT